MRSHEHGPLILWHIMTDSLMLDSGWLAEAGEMCRLLGAYPGKGTATPILALVTAVDRSNLCRRGTHIPGSANLGHVFTLGHAERLTGLDENMLHFEFARNHAVPCAAGVELRAADLPVYWVAKSEDIKACASADDTNDRLGLGFAQFYPPGNPTKTYLVRLDYPAGAAIALRRPSAFAAGAHHYYRVNLDTGDLWGRTQRLTTGIRDLPEAVHDAIRTTGGYSVIGIGELQKELQPDYYALLRNAEDDFRQLC